MVPAETKTESQHDSNTPPHLLPARGAARVGLVMLLGALLAEVVSAVRHDGVTEPLPADDASEWKVVVALHLSQPAHQKNDNAAISNSGEIQQQAPRVRFQQSARVEKVAKKRGHWHRAVHGHTMELKDDFSEASN